MPVSLSEIKKIPTPRQILSEGTYKAIIAGVVYPNNTYGRSGYKMQFLLQVRGPKGICYLHSIPFYLSVVEDGEFFKLMRNVGKVNTDDEMLKWFEECKFIENNMLDETAFIGLPVYAKVTAHKKGTNDITNSITEFSFCPDSEALSLDATKLIPKLYCANSTKLEYATELAVVK